MEFLFPVCPIIHVDGSWDLSGWLYFGINFKALRVQCCVWLSSEDACVFSHFRGVMLENTRKYTRVTKVRALHAHVTRKERLS